jgi:hypothetical protein
LIFETRPINELNKTTFLKKNRKKTKNMLTMKTIDYNYVF